MTAEDFAQLSSDSQRDPVAPDSDGDQLRLAALRLLQRREHSRQELAQKLQRRFATQSPRVNLESPADEQPAGLQPAALDTVLDALQREGLQSDRRFAESVLRDRRERGYGPLWIRADLQRRGVSASLIDQLLATAASEWPALLQALYRRRFGAGPSSGAAGFQRRKRFLLNRGFPPELVHRVCTEPASGCATDD